MARETIEVLLIEGIYYVTVMLLLYKVVYVPTMVNNCEAWSNITAKNFQALQTAQLKCLKRVMRSASSTPNCIMFLDLAILPIKYEIHIRQLVFIHHIVHLQSSNPVRQVYEQQLEYPFEANWHKRSSRFGLVRPTA